jgi:hypothetical protein
MLISPHLLTAITTRDATGEKSVALAGPAGRRLDRFELAGLPRQRGDHVPRLDPMALVMLMRRLGAGVINHGMRSSFHDWAGDETGFPPKVCGAALARAVGDESAGLSPR